MVPAIEGGAVRVYSFILTFLRGVLGDSSLVLLYGFFGIGCAAVYIFRPFGNFCFVLRLAIRFR